ncbi:hypothetical protein [Synechocystis sp. PCC 7509]|nr:hypothetical protein [Synechocystis sp. PCC 7509]
MNNSIVEVDGVCFETLMLEHLIAISPIKSRNLLLVLPGENLIFYPQILL